MKKLYIAVTPDKFELPVYVADTPMELARVMGTSPNTVLSVISHSRQHKHPCTYQRIDYTEREWDE